jgi:hypothetical protein
MRALASAAFALSCAGCDPATDPAQIELARCDDCSRLDVETTVAVSGAAEDYERQCRGCHRADGFGVPGAIPPLTNAMGLFLRVRGGREYLIRVPGVANAPIDDARLAAVLNWSLRRYSPREIPADFTPFTAGEVARQRARPLYEVQAERRRMIERLGAAGALPD